MGYTTTLGMHTYFFSDLKEVLAKATPERSGDHLAGIVARSEEQRIAARFALAEIPLKNFLNEALIPYESDEVTRLIMDGHDVNAFSHISHLTVGGFKEWLLSNFATTEMLKQVAPGVTPEMASAVSKLMRNQELVFVAQKCRIVTAFRNTIGLPGRMSVRLQPNHPTDDPRFISASILDGLLYGCGDAVIDVNPASDNIESLTRLIHVLDEVIQRYAIPTQSCVLAPITDTLKMIQHRAPVDLVYQMIEGTEDANKTHGFNLALLAEAREAALSLDRGTVGNNVMYFETEQGSALAASAHHGVDQQTCEARAYAVARKFNPLLINTVVGFLGPDYLYNGKQLIRAGLESHFSGKLMGLPMGCDICFTHREEADQDDTDSLLTLLSVAGATFIIGVPETDDTLIDYHRTSFQDAQYVRQVLGLKRAPEFETWLETMKIINVSTGQLLDLSPQHPLLALLPAEPASEPVRLE